MLGEEDNERSAEDLMDYWQSSEQFEGYAEDDGQFDETVTNKNGGWPGHRSIVEGCSREGDSWPKFQVIAPSRDAIATAERALFVAAPELSCEKSPLFRNDISVLWLRRFFR